MRAVPDLDLSNFLLISSSFRDPYFMIYLVRHGQTEFNASSRFQGQVDSPLTELGRAQARRVGRSLRRLVDPANVTLFSSPLGRAHATASIISEELGVSSDIILDARLMEVGMGSWDGLTDYEIEMEWPKARDGLGRYEWFFHSPDGESYDAMETRLAGVLDEISNYPAAMKIIVSHGVAGRMIRRLFAGLDRQVGLSLDVPQDAIFRLENGTVTRLECEA
jgi:probable phosphoglycerate mutase